MIRLKAILHEIVALFVDDVSFAFFILAWIGFAAFLLPRLGLAHRWRGAILFGGLAVILMESAVRFSRQHGK